MGSCKKNLDPIFAEEDKVFLEKRIMKLDDRQQKFVQKAFECVVQ